MTERLLEHQTPLAFDEVIARLKTAIAQAGLTLFAQIDHAAGARDVGLTMPPTMVLIYGNPKGGTPIMLAAPNAALDLPLHVLIRESDGGGCVIAFHPIAPLLTEAGVSQELAAKLEPAQQLLLKAVAP